MGKIKKYLSNTRGVHLMSNQEKYLDTAEKYYIYQNSEKGIQINDRSTTAKTKYFT
jgi:hypothetical protein